MIPNFKPPFKVGNYHWNGFEDVHSIVDADEKRLMEISMTYWDLDNLVELLNKAWNDKLSLELKQVFIKAFRD